MGDGRILLPEADQSSPVAAPSGYLSLVIDEATKRFATIDDTGALVPYGLSTVDESNVYYVGKHGNDANDGKNTAQAKLTFANAIAAAVALTPATDNRFVIKCEDGGEYTENIAVPAWVYVIADGASLIGNHTLEDDSSISANVITAASGVAVEKDSGTGHSFISCVFMEVTDSVDGIENSTTGKLIIDIETLHVENGDGIINSSSGEIYAEVGHFVVDGTGRAILSTGSGESHFRISGIEGASGSGVVMTGTGIVNALLGGLECSVAYNIGAGCTFNAFASILSGTETAIGTANVLTPIMQNSNPQFSQMRGWIDGFKNYNNSTTPASQWDIEEGRASNADADTIFELDKTCIVDITKAGANGLDTGGETADTWYWLWAINTEQSVPLVEGTTDGTTANKLIDSAALFQTASVAVGDPVYNVTDGTWAKVTAIDSETTLSIDNDIFVSGEGYEVRPEVVGMFSISYTSPTMPTGYSARRLIGVARNDSGSNFLEVGQYGRGTSKKYMYREDADTTLQLLSAGAATVMTLIDCSTLVPPNVTLIQAFPRCGSKGPMLISRLVGGPDEKQVKSNDQDVMEMECSTSQGVYYRNGLSGGDSDFSVLGFTLEI